MRKELIIMSVGTNTGTEKAAIYARLSVEDIERTATAAAALAIRSLCLKITVPNTVTISMTHMLMTVSQAQSATAPTFSVCLKTARRAKSI